MKQCAHHRSHWARTALVSAGLALSLAAPAQAQIATQTVPTTVIVGMDDQDQPINPPSQPTWNVGTMGPWNGKGARYNEATDRLAFETIRDDIRGASFLRDEKTNNTTRKSTNAVAQTLFDASIDPASSQATLKTLFPFYDDHYDPDAVEVIGEGPTAVVFITNKDGQNGLCVGCWDVVATNTAGGIRILKANPQTDGAAANGDFTVLAAGTIIYARQNKDLPAWHPGGDWIIAAVEMPVHAGLHGAGNGEVGMFTNMYAIYVGGQTEAGQPLFGKIWVQLTDWGSTWGSLYDNVSMVPYDATETKCTSGNQYWETTGQVPFYYYHCSAANQPPPTSGVMRPTISPGVIDGDDKARIAWGARVGLAVPVQDQETCESTTESLPGGGVQLLGTGQIDLYNVSKTDYPSSLPDVPIILNFNSALGPTHAVKSGVNTWKGIDYSDPPPQVGQWYEPFSFTNDNNKLLFASDTYLTYRDGASYPPTEVSAGTFFFMDVVERNYTATTMRSITDYNSSSNAYDYLPNSTSAPYTAVRDWGAWEEPVTHVTWGGANYFAFGSNANTLDESIGTPTNTFYDLTRHLETMALEVMIMKDDLSLVKEITNFNDGSSEATFGGCVPDGEDPPEMVGERIVYPTDFATDYGTLYISDVPSGHGGDNPAAKLRKMNLGAWLDADNMD